MPSLSVVLCAAASSSALSSRQIDELTSAISALKAGLDEKLDTVTAEQEETRNAVLELRARQGQAAVPYTALACCPAPHVSSCRL